MTELEKEVSCGKVSGLQKERFEEALDRNRVDSVLSE